MRSARIVAWMMTTTVVALWPATAAVAQDWPQFRGPTGQGHAQVTGLPLQWSETENVAWKTELPGRGWSSPVIQGGAIWMTTALDTPAPPDEAEQRLVGNTNSQPLLVADRLSLRAICVDQKSGELLHDIELMVEEKPQAIHTLNSYASPTPVIENGRLYCHFGTYGTACVDTRTGEVLWTNRQLRIEHENGPGSSPVLYGDLLIFHCDGSDEQYVAALDKATGKLAWKTPRSGEMQANPQLKKAYGTPLILSIDDRPQLISPAADWLYAYDPASGEELWKLNYGVLGFSIVPRPVAGQGMVYICTSFMQPELLAVRYDGEGESKEPHIAWRYARQAPKQPSPLLVGDQLYILSDQGIATCLDAQSGEVHWSSRLGGNYSASPLYADGRIYCFSHEGETLVLEPGTTYKLLARNPLDGSLMASAAAVDGALFLRTDRALYRIEKSAGAE